MHAYANPARFLKLARRFGLLGGELFRAVVGRLGLIESGSGGRKFGLRFAHFRARFGEIRFQ